MKINTSTLYFSNNYSKLTYNPLQPTQTDIPSQKNPQKNSELVLSKNQDPVSVSKSNMSQKDLKNLSSDKLKIIESLIEDFTGKDVEIVDIDKFYFLHKGYTSLKENLTYTDKFSPHKNQLNTKYNKLYKDIDKVKMDLELTVKTDEGKELDVNIELDLSQEFIQNTNFAMKSKTKPGKNIVNLISRENTIFKYNFHFEIDIMPSSNQQLEHDALGKSQIPGRKFQEINPLETIAVNENSKTIQNNDLLGQNKLKHATDSEQDNLKEKIQQQDITSIFNFFNIWSKDNEKKFLFAIGLITQEKIYLSPIHNDKIKNIPNSGGKNYDSK
ncbi:hypothetical protein [Desulfothermus sp.]